MNTLESLKETRSQLLRRELEQYTGTLHYTRVSPLLIATDGAIAFAQKADCFWLLQDIAAVLPALKKDDFYTVKMTVQNSSAVVAYGDGNRHTYYTQMYEWADAPVGEWVLWIEQADEKQYCILLPSEH